MYDSKRNIVHVSIVHFNVIAFWFKAPGDDIYAPKVGMDVTIVDSGFTKHDSNPAHESPFAKSWKLLTLGYDSKKMLHVLLHTQSKYDSTGEAIEPMDILVEAPACSLKYSNVHSGYGTVNYTLLSPTDMCKRWKINVDSGSKTDLNVSVSHEVKNGKLQKPKVNKNTQKK